MGSLSRADITSRSAAVRAVLLQLLQHTDAIYRAFHAALVTATESEGFAQLQHAPEGAAVDIGGTRVSTRHLATVAAELKEGLHVGVCSAMERVLQVRARCITGCPVVIGGFDARGVSYRQPMLLACERYGA